MGFLHAITFIIISSLSPGILLIKMLTDFQSNPGERVTVIYYDQGKKYFIIQPGSENLDPSSEFKIEERLSFESRDIQLKFQNQVDKTSYKFILEGYDTQWATTNGNESIIYSNLSPGNYSLKVISTRSLEESSISFEILSPFWTKWWFSSIMVGLSLVIIMLYNQWRLKVKMTQFERQQLSKTTEIERLRKEMARNFHDKLGNKLASISVIVDLVNLKLKKKEDDVEDLLLKIDHQAKTLFDGTKDFIWALDSESDNLTDCFNYIKDYAEELFGRSKTIFISSQIGFIGQDTKLRPGANKELLSLLKIIYHCYFTNTKSEKVSLFIGVEKGKFHMQIEDDGKSGLEERYNCYRKIKKSFKEFKIATKYDQKSHMVLIIGDLLIKSKLNISQTQN